MIFVINIDWLEVFGHLDCALPSDTYFDELMYSKKYKFEKQDYSGRTYRHKYKVYDGSDNYIYDVYIIPTSSILKPNSCTIRLSNSECYNSNCFEDLEVFMSDIGFKFNNITRLDICHDSNNLKNGLTHENLLKGFLSGRFRLNRRLKFNLYGSNTGSDFSGISIDYQRRKKLPITEITKDNELSADLTTTGAKWGSQKSAVGVKIYNKTLEMREVKRKQSIINSWKDNGLNLEKDVWRVEISLNSDSLKWLDVESGELFTLTTRSEELTKDLERTFFSICNKYLKFKINNGEDRVSRMADLEIFSERTIHRKVRRYREDNIEKSNKMEKYMVKRLLKETQDFKTYSEEERMAIDNFTIHFARKWGVGKINSEGNLTINDIKDFCYYDIESAEEKLKKLQRWQMEICRQKELLFNNHYVSQIDVSWNIPPLIPPKAKTSVQ